MHRDKDHDLDLIHPENVPSWEKIKQPHIHAAIDLPPQNIQQRHLSRKLFLACSDRKIRTLNIPKRMESLLVGKFFKDLRCGPTDLEVIQPTVPLCLELMDRGTTLSSLLWIGGSTGTVTVRDGSGIPSGACNCAGATVDSCGTCGGSGIPSGACNCAGATVDACGVCGGSGIPNDLTNGFVSFFRHSI